jgi:AraC family transcriptional regulator
MSVSDTSSFGFTTRSHVEGDPVIATSLLQYHISEREIAGFHSTETSHPPRFRIPEHFHDLASLYLVLNGSLTEFYDHKTRECKPPSVVFTPPGEKHSNLFDDRGGRCFLVEVPSTFVDRFALAGVKLEQSLHSEGGALAWLAMKLYREFESPDAVSLLAVEGLMLEALSELGRWNDKPAATVPIWLRQAHELLHDRFRESLRLDEIATLVGVHPAHLARSFRRCYGSTVGEYQRRLRIEYASRQLSETGISISNIAVAAGFADQAHFSRTFRNHTGMTPAKFRIAVKEK